MNRGALSDPRSTVPIANLLGRAAVLILVLAALATLPGALGEVAANSLAVDELTAPARAAQRGLDTFAALAGRWQGSTADGIAMELDYEVVAGGHAVLERARLQGHPEMLTVYYRDGERLLLTHYCGNGSQPRMAAKHYGEGTVAFDLMDVTGVPTAETGHMARALFRFVAEDRLVSEWTWRQGGQEQFTVISTTRRVAANQS